MIDIRKILCPIDFPDTADRPELPPDLHDNVLAGPRSLREYITRTYLVAAVVAAHMDGCAVGANFGATQMTERS
jgi:hypothetical protein